MAKTFYSEPSTVAKQQKARFWKLNSFILLAIGSTLINLFYFLADGMLYSAYTEIAGITVLLVCIFCNQKRYFSATRVLSVGVVNVQVFLLCYFHGTSSGDYLYLFPLLLAIIYYLYALDNKWGLVIFISLITINILLVVLFLPYKSAIEHLSDEKVYAHLVVNVIVNFFLTIAFFYYVLQLLNNKDKKTKNEKRFTDTLINTSLEAVFVIDPVSMEVKQYNKKAADLFAFPLWDTDTNRSSYKLKGLLGTRIDECITDLLAKQNGPIEWQGEMGFMPKNNTPFLGFISIVSFSYAERSFLKLGVLDISAVKKAEAQMLLAKEKAEKAAAAKTRFMSNMSHELRTPLNAIIGTMHLLIQDDEQLQYAEHFTVLKSSSEHMLQLVNEVLDFSKLDAGKLELVNSAFDLTVAIKEVTSSFSAILKQKGLDFFVEADELPEGIKVVGDEMRLKQIFFNLLSNAAKFTAQGAVTLQVNIKKITDTTADIYFSVTDNGIGIPPEKQSLIFESFTQADAETTRKYGGSGLGLSICKELVKQMGGDLRVDSEPGEGSRFFFTLAMPIEQPKKGITPITKLKELENITGARVLLAEDNPLNMKIALRFLQNWGVQVETAGNGKIAWDKFNNGSFDMLLIDLEMPEMDGKQFLQLVRTVNPTIPAIAFTAAVYENMYEDLQQHGFDSYLHKPFQPAELHQKVWFYSTRNKNGVEVNE